MMDGSRTPPPIPYVDLSRHWAQEKDAILPEVERVLAGGFWVGGPEVRAFEQAFEAYGHVPHCIGTASGTDAIILALRALDIGPGDEVIVPPNSFVASAGAVVMVGATPVFADVLPDQNLDPEAVIRAIGPNTRAIMAVHLTGRMGPMDLYREIADDNGLALIEDAAQSVGSSYLGRKSGAWGDVGCFSAHPLKNLNAAGDAGFVATRHDDLAARIRRLGNNGSVDRDTVVEWGMVSRLDPVQAVVLSHRLAHLDEVIAARQANAERYLARLDRTAVFHPGWRENAFDTYHTFVIQVDRRDELKAYLAENGIGTAIHYPVPIHLQPAAAELGHGPGSFPKAEAQAGRILSLPINQFVTEAEIDRVADAINGFYA
ncbi:MAG: DegT/DnrJ/EryC1/StrS family aminotransferase [Magnetovibrionaceae bacterium]